MPYKLTAHFKDGATAIFSIKYTAFGGFMVRGHYLSWQNETPGEPAKPLGPYHAPTLDDLKKHVCEDLESSFGETADCTMHNVA